MKVYTGRQGTGLSVPGVIARACIAITSIRLESDRQNRVLK